MVYTKGIEKYWDVFCDENPKLIEDLSKDKSLHIAKLWYLRGIHNAILDISINFSNTKHKSIEKQLEEE